MRQMSQSLKLKVSGVKDLQILWEDSEHALCRGRSMDRTGRAASILLVVPTLEHPSPGVLERFTHEYGLKSLLDAAFAARPLELLHQGGRTMLALDDPGGEPLEPLIGKPTETERFLRLAIEIAAALAQAHQAGLVHKDLKPVHILVDCADGRARLIGFGIASQRPRERQSPEPPEVIAGTLAYMAPEQTGRMNRSIDSRSDLYSLGVIFYQMLTGVLPFSAADPMEWVHCHIARKPVVPRERAPDIPETLSAIVMKLLAKTAEQRYQTAGGLGHDLRRALFEWERGARIDLLALGERDRPDRLIIPEKLYGREREVEALLAAFDHVVASGAPELVLVSGASGAGKSSVVNELQKNLVASSGLFASGKFDQYKRHIPYSTLAQAFQTLTRSLLTKSEAELVPWRNALRKALGPNARLITDLVPELTLIIGEPPPAPELDPQQAKARFQLTLRRFIALFARAEHPLALFLDDLQWLDRATLDLMEDLLTHPEVGRLLLIGAYRDNEIDPHHPLTGKLAAIRNSGASVSEIKLGPLRRIQVKQLVADALGSEAGPVEPLADLVYAKTAGNPYFAISFLAALADQRLLVFDHLTGGWSWDIDRIRAKGTADNVVDLLLGKLARLPEETRHALLGMASLGAVAASATLGTVLGMSQNEVHAALWDAVRAELIEPLRNSYRFVHDRVQEAAYSLIPEEQRAAAHLRIGRILIEQTAPEKREEAIFDIVNQLNRGARLIVDPHERERLAELNLAAGRRAKASAAYKSALNYLAAAASLLPSASSEAGGKLAFQLELDRAECEFLTGAPAEAERRLEALSRAEGNTVERASVACLRADLGMALGAGRAVEIGLEYLRQVGVEWSSNPTDEEVRREYDRIWSQIGERKIEDLIDLPLMREPDSLATLEVLIKMAPPAVLTSARLAALVVGRAVNLSLEHGACDASGYAYAQLATVLGPQFGDYQAGYRFAQLGYDLIEKRGLRRFAARIYLQCGYLAPWTRHVRQGRDLLRRAFDTANATGDLTNAAYACDNLNSNFLAAGDPLQEAQREAESGLAFARKARVGFVIDLIVVQLGLIRSLRGSTARFGSLEHEGLDESQMERRFSQNPDLAIAECWYWIRKLQARFLAGDYAAANEAATHAERLLWTSPAKFETAEFAFYAALSCAAACGASADAGQRSALAAHLKQLQIWAEHCPENFADRAALVAAEAARIEGRALDAERLYEEAIASARANGFLHNEAIAKEVAGRFYAERGFESIARMYLRDARHAYLLWGADAKVRQLDETYPHLAEEQRAPSPMSTIGATVERLDLATVIKVSQAVTGEILPEKLIDTLMRTAVEQAGAERGALVLSHGAEHRVAAEAATDGNVVRVRLLNKAIAPDELPEAVIHYVARAQETVILDDAGANSRFASDPYISRREACSILCLPLIKQGKLIGALYLENKLARGAFSPAGIAVLKLIASQAAVSLENTRLYHDLQQREAKIRRLVDANIIGIFVAERDGQVIEANDAFLRIVGYDRDDLAAGRLRRDDLTAPEWRDRTTRAASERKVTGIVQPYEKEYIRKDGSRAPVLIGAASFEESGNQSVVFVLDLSERKRAEGAVREMQMQLAHANRIETMGLLTGSIAHEVNQPIAATVTNAQAALRFLRADPPELEDVGQALGRIVRDGSRAGAVVGRIRNLIKRAPARDDWVDVNELIREVLDLTRNETLKNGVAAELELVEGLPLILGDRVELQQVLLNLILNAVEAMRAESEGPRELRIATGRTESGEALVSVSDTGPGVAAVQANLFKAFHTTKPGGLGMGLSICRSIVEARGGRLWASDNAPRGAVFQFTLPVQPDDAPPAETSLVNGGGAPAG